MLRHLIQLMTGSALGKVLGLVREVVFASFFGTSSWADAYRAAMATTFSLSHLLTSEALNAAFIPQFARERSAQAERSWTLFNGVTLLLLTFSMLAAVGIFFFADGLTTHIYAGFDDDTAAQTQQMLRVMALGVVPYVLSAMWIAVEMAQERFFWAALRPLVQNVGVIVAIALASLQDNPLLIAWGFSGTYLVLVLVAGVIVLRRLRRHGWLLHLQQHRGVALTFWKALRPMLLFSVLLQLGILTEKAIGSLIGSGAVAATDYARLLPETAHVLLVVPLGMISLATLAKLDHDAAMHRVALMIQAAALLLVPTSALLIVAAEPIVHAVYARGAFDAQAVAMTSLALKGMALGLWAVGLAHVLQKVLSARLRNSSVLRIGMAGVAINIVVSLACYRSLGVLALGLGYSANGMLMAGLCMRSLGGLRTSLNVLLLLLLAAVPYAGVATLVPRYVPMAPWTALAAHVAWALVYWLLVVMLIPQLRQLAHLLLLHLRRREDAQA